MISSGNYENADTIPAFLELDNHPKKTKRITLTDATTGAAVIFANAVTSKSPEAHFDQLLFPLPILHLQLARPSNPGIPPGRITDLRMKKLHELREFQGLLEQNVLTQEFAEQKRLVLNSLRKLTQ